MKFVKPLKISNFLRSVVVFHIYLFTTMSVRPEPEYTLRRVMSSEPIQDEQLTKDCKQMTHN